MFPIRLCGVAIALGLASPPSAAQSWHESFADGDLTVSPAWTGSLPFWRLAPAGADWTLFSAGPEASDTLFLETASTVASGLWKATVGFVGGPPSNFNLARVYLTAGGDGPLHEAPGYYLQIGSNDRDIRLYRNEASGRVLLGQSEPGLLADDEAVLPLAIVRSGDSIWQVSRGDSLLFAVEEPDAPAFSPTRFGLWVKHTRTRGEDFFFDDLSAEADAAPPPPAIEPGAVIVNEIDFAPAPAEGEFIELYNRSELDVDIRGLLLADSRDEPVSASRTSIPLRPGGFVVLTRDSAAFATAFPGRTALEVSGWPSLNNDTDAVRLFSGEVLVDAVFYEAGWGRVGASLERVDPAGPSDFSGNWAASTDPAGGTPGQVNSVYAPDTSPPRLVLAEAIRDREVIAFWNEPLAADRFGPDRFLVGAAAPERAELMAPATVRLVFDAPLAGDRLEAEGLADRTGNVIDRTQHPIAFFPSEGEIALNEILYDPLADPYDGRPDQPEYVEIVNNTERWLSLRHLRLLGPIDERGDADTLRHEAAFASVPPGGFAVWYAARAGSLADAFPSLADAPDAVLLPVDAASLGLNNEGDRVRVGQDTSTVAELAYSPNWHHPSLAATKGFSLERRWPSAPAAAPASWSSSVALEGGTPGRPNAIAQSPGTPPPPGEIAASPRVFSPDGDGRDEVCDVRFSLPEAPAVVRIRLFDSEGRLVRTLTDASLTAAGGSALWDGRDQAGRTVRVGVYVVLVEAFFAGRRAQGAYKETVVVARTSRSVAR